MSRFIKARTILRRLRGSVGPVVHPTPEPMMDTSGMPDDGAWGAHGRSTLRQRLRSEFAPDDVGEPRRPDDA